MYSEKLILWGILFLGILLLTFCLWSPPIKDKLLVFLFTAYCSVIFGVIVVEKGMLSYPVNLFDRYFNSSMLYEFLLLPLTNVFYFKTTFHSSWIGMIGQGIVYATALTFAEVLVERYTNFIHYKTWTWQASFISIFLVLFLIRAGFYCLNKLTPRKN